VPRLPEPTRPRHPLIELLPPPETGVAARPEPPHRPRWGLAALLFGLTVATTTTLGSVWALYLHPTYLADVGPWLSPHTLAYVWGDPWRLSLGLAFALPALGILLCHELGHYVACRVYRLPSTVPYFLPLPIGLGTLGAFIRIRAPIRCRRQLFDVGVAGPIAGFVALLPFLVLGVAWSEPVEVAALAGPEAAAPAGWLPADLWVPGRSVALMAVSRLLHGPLPDGTLLHLHPFALAAWFGLLVTAINLLPVGQLDGGHILYAAAGKLQWRVALPVWLGLGVAAFFFFGWIVWCLILLLMGLPHPPVRDERERLGPGRMALAWTALAILVLSFMPVPVEQWTVAVPRP